MIAPNSMRERRAMREVERAIRYGLSLPDSAPARQARLLADIFGPELALLHVAGAAGAAPSWREQHRRTSPMARGMPKR